tara:strand:- start:150 stop:878 length:729 start_codon:yes stop_codon:yes gene_type:complete
MERVKSLEGKTIAIVGLGKSWFEYCLAKSHGVHFDEVWAINSVGSVIFHDRVFMMDPASRFFDSDNAGDQTDSIVKMLEDHKGPIYTCELDERAPGLVEYPIHEILKDTDCYYLNNTVSYAVAFALWNKVGTIKMFGIDFSYQGNLHFAESGRASVEFWLGKCMNDGIQVEVASSSGLLDTCVPVDDKLYGYHRLDDPLVVSVDQGGSLYATKKSNLNNVKKETEYKLADRYDSHLGEPKQW